MLIKFSISTGGWHSFVREVSDEVMADYRSLPSGSDYRGFFRERLADDRFSGPKGTCMIWEPICSR